MTLTGQVLRDARENPSGAVNPVSCDDYHGMGDAQPLYWRDFPRILPPAWETNGGDNWDARVEEAGMRVSGLFFGSMLLLLGEPGIAAQSAPTSADATRSEAISIADNLVKQSGINGYRLIPIDGTENPWGVDVDTAWTDGSIYGALTVDLRFSPENIKTVVIPDGIAVMRKTCKDGNVTSRVEEVTDVGVSNTTTLFLSCKWARHGIPDGISVYETYMPRQGGGYYWLKLVQGGDAPTLDEEQRKFRRALASWRQSW